MGELEGRGPSRSAYAADTAGYNCRWCYQEQHGQACLSSHPSHLHKRAQGHLCRPPRLACPFICHTSVAHACTRMRCPSLTLMDVFPGSSSVAMTLTRSIIGSQITPPSLPLCRSRCGPLTCAASTHARSRVQLLEGMALCQSEYWWLGPADCVCMYVPMYVCVCLYVYILCACAHACGRWVALPKKNVHVWCVRVVGVVHAVPPLCSTGDEWKSKHQESLQQACPHAVIAPDCVLLRCKLSG